MSGTARLESIGLLWLPYGYLMPFWFDVDSTLQVFAEVFSMHAVTSIGAWVLGNQSLLPLVQLHQSQ